MGELGNVIFQKHLRFMSVLQKNFKNIPSEDYYELEVQFKDMCRLADKCLGAEAFSNERIAEHIGGSHRKEGSHHLPRSRVRRH